MRIKKVSAVLACMLVLTMCLTLTACGLSKYAGTWEAAEVKAGGITAGIPEEFKNFTFTLESGGKAKANMVGVVQEEGISWKKTDSGIQLINSVGTMDFTYEDGTLVGEILGAEVIFEKQ